MSNEGWLWLSQGAWFLAWAIDRLTIRALQRQLRQSRMSQLPATRNWTRR